MEKRISYIPRKIVGLKNSISLDFPDDSSARLTSKRNDIQCITTGRSRVVIKRAIYDVVLKTKFRCDHIPCGVFMDDERTRNDF